MFKKLRTVIYHTDNFHKEKEWYTHITGIQLYFDQPFYVGFDINGFKKRLDRDMDGIEKGTSQ